MRKNAFLFLFLTTILSFAWLACREENKPPAAESIGDINLKRGNIVVCGPADKQFGTVGFAVANAGKAQQEFNLAMALLHSFEYDEAEKMFAKVIDTEPACAMAYWGVAMSNYHPLWAPPSQQELEKGAKAIAIARSLGGKTKEESAYIDAVALFYDDWQKTDHRTRSLRYEKEMEKIYLGFPNNKEAAVFYALALTATADPADKTFAQQQKAGEILNKLYPGQPDHPGIVHYIIHAYDNPVLAELALTAARKYASVAPSSAHALHMPSHIFTRLGLWTEGINSNLLSVSSAQCYAQSAGIKGHWDEELHGLDYLVYAYLQRGDNAMAQKYLDYLHTMNEIHPANFKVAYAFAAIPSRYVLENKLWKEASVLKVPKANFSWHDFPWQKAIIHFARVLGSVHTGQLNAAKADLQQLHILRDTLLQQKNNYQADQVQAQILAATAWIALKENKQDQALQSMTAAADMEDRTGKHAVTPGQVIPARELLGEMLLLINKPIEALTAFETSLKEQRNRFNAVYGAAVAAEKANNLEKAGYYYRLLTEIAEPKTNRQELITAKNFLARHRV